MPVVDEAATRIREEVDEDANIIVGFTFERAWKISSASRWWRLASIILARRAASLEVAPDAAASS
jgi:hypothetical protein